MRKGKFANLQHFLFPCANALKSCVNAVQAYFQQTSNGNLPSYLIITLEKPNFSFYLTDCPLNPCATHLQSLSSVTKTVHFFRQFSLRLFGPFSTKPLATSRCFYGFSCLTLGLSGCIVCGVPTQLHADISQKLIL